MSSTGQLCPEIQIRARPGKVVSIVTDIEFIEVLHCVLPNCDNKTRLFLIYSAFRDAASFQQKLGFSLGSEVLISEGRASVAEAINKILNKGRCDES
jgi:hypothetical protein